MKRTIKVPAELRRDFGMAEKKEDGTIRLSISSDEPYLRYDWWADEEYYEVLDHSSEGVDVSRITKGTALLFNHDRDVQLGTINTPVLENGRCYVTAKMSDADDVASYRQRVNEGILKDTSIGYNLLDEGTCTGAKDGIPIYKFRFAINEASLVTIPADTSVGVGRQRSTKDAEGKDIKFREIVIDDPSNICEKKPTEKDMKLTPAAKRHFMEAEKGGGSSGGGSEINVVAEREEAARGALAEFQKKCDDIDAFIDRLPKPAWKAAASDIAKGFKKVTDKRTFQDFREEALIKCEETKSTETPEGSELGLSKKERKAFSLRKALYEIAMQHRNVGKGLTGHELAVCKAAQDLYQGQDQREWVGLCVPDDITNGNFAEDQDLNSRALQNLADNVNRLRSALNVSTFTQGGALVGTDLLGGSMIDILRNAVLVGNGALAITELGGLVGNIAIPKQTSTSTVYWLAEGAPITQSIQTFAQLLMTPHRIGVATQYTKQLLAQASIGVEAFVRSDQMLTQAVEEDRVAFLGSGNNGEPQGIFNTTGIIANVTFGGNATWQDMINLEFGLENANVRTGQMAIVTSPTTKSYLKQTLVVPASTFPIFIWGKNEGWPIVNGVMPGVINDYPAYATKNVTTSQMVQGVFKNFFKARWAGFDVVVDPYTGALSELINIICNSWLDQALRYPQSFNVTTDAPTSP